MLIDELRENAEDALRDCEMIKNPSHEAKLLFKATVNMFMYVNSLYGSGLIVQVDKLKETAEKALIDCAMMNNSSEEMKILYKAVVSVFQYMKLLSEQPKASNEIPLKFRPIDPQPGDHYRHFKGNAYEIISSNATNCTNSNIKSDRLVVYKSVNTGDVWVRSYDEFMSPVDTIKYPDCKQFWRFEKIK